AFDSFTRNDIPAVPFIAFENADGQSVGCQSQFAQAQRLIGKILRVIFDRETAFRLPSLRLPHRQALASEFGIFIFEKKSGSVSRKAAVSDISPNPIEFFRGLDGNLLFGRL